MIPRPSSAPVVLGRILILTSLLALAWVALMAAVYIIVRMFLMIYRLAL